MTRWRTMERDADGRPWVSLAREGRRLHLRFRGVGRFVFAPGGGVDGFPDSGVDDATFRRFLVDQVLPRALHRAGVPVLHASAVAGPRGALVFLGESGAGKSTLATRYALRGWPLLADDGVRLEVRDGRVLAHPTHPFLRVREDCFRRLPRRIRELAVPEGGKWTLDARRRPLRFARNAVPIHQIFLLGRPMKKHGPFGLREALLALLDGTFRADPWDIEAFARDLRFFATVAEAVPIFRHGVRA